MLGCSALYVFTEDVPILMWESSALDRIVSCATDRQMTDSVAHNIDRMRDSAESAFISSLNAVLQASAARDTRAWQGVVTPLAVSRR
jgi:hypothetical protein